MASTSTQRASPVPPVGQTLFGLRFPRAGERLGDFQLVAELDRGAVGRVFLATQPGLSDRPVVLKLTRSTGQEHLALARLQHTYIAPLYLTQEFPAHQLRALCMPYLGGASLSRVLEDISDVPPALRSGRTLVQSLERHQRRHPVNVPAKGPALRFLSRASYEQAVCWIGGCLAEALHYAHERGLVHLDIKPSNVLLAGEGQPLLLDFHLARQPLTAGAATAEGMGGTPGFMSPEQEQVLEDLRAGQPVSRDVDARADIYSLAMTLYEALGGSVPDTSRHGVPPLRAACPHVSRRVDEILGRCLAVDPERRYPNAGALAEDLRQHVASLAATDPRRAKVRGRFSGLRKRRTVPIAVAAAAVSLMAVLAYCGARWHAGQIALEQGRQQLQFARYADAAKSFRLASVQLRGVPGAGSTVRQVEDELRRAQWGVSATEFTRAMDRLRWAFAESTLSPRRRRELDATCRALWETRTILAAGLRNPGDSEPTPSLQRDLAELAVCWTVLQQQTSPAGDQQNVHRRALDILKEAEKLCGPMAVLRAEQARHAEALGSPEPAATSPGVAAVESSPAWYYLEGRRLFESGQPQAAAAALQKAVDADPSDFWAHFFLGRAYQQSEQPAEAAESLSVCIALRPKESACYCYRAMARASLGNMEAAIADYGRALELDPLCTMAAINRALLYLDADRRQEARQDLQQAASGGHSAAWHYAWARWHLADNNRAGARQSLQMALREDPQHERSQQLLERLSRSR